MHISFTLTAGRNYNPNCMGLGFLTLLSIACGITRFDALLNCGDSTARSEFHNLGLESVFCTVDSVRSERYGAERIDARWFLNFN